MRVLVVLMTIICCVLARLWTSSAASARSRGAKWDGLRAGFGFNYFSQYTFAAMPRTVDQAVYKGWKLDQSAGGCGVSGTKFNGNRYILVGDPAVMLLFDKNGYIAGIQAGIPKNRTDVYPGPQNRKYNVFNEEDNMWVITAYFVEPAEICTTGRTQADFDRDGTGYMLAVQMGPSASSLMRIPNNESQVLTTTRFVEGMCFYGMGKHYWYDVTEDMSCDDTFPVFIMYNNGVLTAFGWAFNINFETSYRWEHPTKGVFKNFIMSPPKCLGNDEPVTTLHVYMTNRPWSNRC